MFLIGLLFGYWIRKSEGNKKKKKKKRKNHSVTEICPHDMAEIKVIASVATCEKTVLVCSQCGEYLSKPKTET